MENNIFWSEIGSGFGEPGGTPPTSRSTLGHAATSGYEGMLSLADILYLVDYIRWVLVLLCLQPSMNFNISKLVFSPFPHLPQLATLRLRGRAGPGGFKVHFGTVLGDAFSTWRQIRPPEHSHNALWQLSRPGLPHNLKVANIPCLPFPNFYAFVQARPHGPLESQEKLMLQPRSEGSLSSKQAREPRKRGWQCLCKMFGGRVEGKQSVLGEMCKWRID